MQIKTYVTTTDSEDINSFFPEDEGILDTLGPEENAVAVQLQELFSSVTEAISDSLEAESKLTVEITGSISLKAQGGIKYLLFNAGGEAGKTIGMKVVLSTTLQPKKNTNTN
jgi:hypothetical protein